MTHELKTWPEYFEKVWLRNKTFEVRKNDRDYQQFDHLVLAEYDPKEGKYSGRNIRCEILYILEGGNFGIEKGFVVMSILVLQKNIS